MNCSRLNFPLWCISLHPVQYEDSTIKCIETRTETISVRYINRQQILIKSHFTLKRGFFNTLKFHTQKRKEKRCKINRLLSISSVLFIQILHIIDRFDMHLTIIWKISQQLEIIQKKKSKLYCGPNGLRLAFFIICG